MVEKGLGYERESTMQRSHAGGKGAGVSATRTRRRKERERKAEEETHAMDKPKTIEEVSDGDLTEIKKDPIWKSWLEMIIKPIPDSKGGKGSFQHCINANQDKHNPGGWCKQIERKIGKGLGALGEGKLNRKTGKPMKLKPRKITLDDYEHTDKPSYFEQVMSEEEKKEKEKKKASRKDRAILQQQKREHEAVKYAREHPRPPPPGVGYKPEQEAQYQEYKKRRDAGKADKIEEPETDYYMDAGGNPQLKEKAKKRETTEDGQYADTIDPNVEWAKRMTGWKRSKKADYFIEEIRANIIYHNKIFPIVGMIAGQVARGIGRAGKKVGGEILEGASEIGQSMMQQEEEEEQ